ncbi:MAG: hypothetical protein C4B55_03215 [Candidatus Methanophagaceae archaeon]|nr:MAG: hypothetical protein C4B55_03215 [Methanophagales archaeon]
MENLFEDQEEEGKAGRIFTGKEVLCPTYIPENLPHREKQVKSLRVCRASSPSSPSCLKNINLNRFLISK